MKIAYISDDNCIFYNREDCEKHEKNMTLEFEKATQILSSLNDICKSHEDTCEGCPYYSKKEDNCILNIHEVCDMYEAFKIDKGL